MPIVLPLTKPAILKHCSTQVNTGAADVTGARATSPTLHGEVSDPIGDVGDRPYPNVANPPDLVHATAGVVAGNITFTVQLAPGTFDPGTILLIINLDTDQNPSTGQAPDGVDYIVSMGDGQGNQALVGKYTGPLNFSTVGNVPVSFMADGMMVAVPLSLLGNADGRMNFRVISFIHLPGMLTSAALDSLPDSGLPPGRVQ
jgi:hypothetical protein